MNMMASHSETFGTLSGPDGADTAQRAWTALHDAAAIAFILAGRMVPPSPGEGEGDGEGEAGAGGGIAAHYAAAPPYRQVAVSRGLDDLAIMLEAGLGALLDASGQGGAIGPAAAMLADEFLAARHALLALLGCPQPWCDPRDA